MQQEELTNTSDGDHSTKVCRDRRKRVNRIKIELIILIIILLILPTVLCIILGFRVGRLQQQVDALLSKQNIGTDQIDLSEDYNEEKHYAYAAEKEKPGSQEKDKDSTEGNSAGDAGQAKKITEKVTSAEPVAAIEPAAASASQKAHGLIDSSESGILSESAASSEPATGTDQAVPGADPQSAADNTVHTGRYSGKKVYLTFDDGPSTYSEDILDILKEYQVKATFFVIGHTDAYSRKIYKRIVEEGHTLGMHSYSHKYSRIYNSVEDFDKDFTKLWKLLYDTTGYKPSIFRFPGGSDNMVNKNGMEDFIRYLNDAGIVYFDWNVENGDATGIIYTKEQLIDNVLDGVDIKANSIVLMHDAQNKKTTVDSLPGLLDILISEGAQILPLDKEVTPIQMIKAETIK